MSILSNKNVVWVEKSLRYKPDFVIKKIRNRPPQIHCLNSDGTGDLSLLRYKPDFVINLFVIKELYCIVFTDERQQRQPNHNTTTYCVY
jgi:hypothetical protein